VGSASVEFLQDFVKLNVGSWTGSFTVKSSLSLSFSPSILRMIHRDQMIYI
jgi:hypothetical protein